MINTPVRAPNDQTAADIAVEDSPPGLALVGVEGKTAALAI